MSLPRLRIWIADASSNLHADELAQHPSLFESKVLRFLQQHFAVQLDRDNPMLLLHNNRITTAPSYLCPHIFLSEENLRPPPHKPCEGHIGYADASQRGGLYLPNWALTDCARLIQPPEDFASLMRAKKHFCAFVQHMMRPARYEVFEALAHHRRVDALGHALRNRPAPPTLFTRHRAHDLDTLPAACRPYKFALTFENSAWDGYVTEKMLYALMARTVPIYWGDPAIAELINPACFIHARDFASPQALVAHVMKVDADDDLYRRYLAAPVFRDNRLPPCARWDLLVARLSALLASTAAQRGRSHAECAPFQRESLSRLDGEHVLACLSLHDKRRAREAAPWGPALPAPMSEISILPPAMQP